jgi:hypothetical protein
MYKILNSLKYVVLGKSLLHCLQVHPQCPIAAFESASLVSLYHPKHECLTATRTNPENSPCFILILRVLSVACRTTGAFTPEQGLKRTLRALAYPLADDAVLGLVKRRREKNIYRPANLPHTEFVLFHLLFE